MLSRRRVIDSDSSDSSDVGESLGRITSEKPRKSNQERKNRGGKRELQSKQASGRQPGPIEALSTSEDEIEVIDRRSRRRTWKKDAQRRQRRQKLTDSADGLPDKKQAAAATTRTSPATSSRKRRRHTDGERGQQPKKSKKTRKNGSQSSSSPMAPFNPSGEPAAELIELISEGLPRKYREFAQRQVQEEMLKNFRGNGDFKRVEVAHLRKAFRLIDRHFLGGNLRKLLVIESRKLEFRVSSRMTSRAGHLLSDSRRPMWHELAISSILLLQTFDGDLKTSKRRVVVNGCKVKNRVEALLRLVEHEMLHLLFVCKSMPRACHKQSHHGALFQRAARGIFGHKDFRHDLVTPKEEAGRSGVYTGSTVRFEFRGETLTGKVNRVTKNATILVPTSDNHPDARLFSDQRFYRKFHVPVSWCKVIKKA
ncbi:hypothetical protein AAMO2058_000094000 [Amorphochlora amoebiformis]